MTSQSPRIYTYKITFEEVPYYYYGVHKEMKYDEYYMGTPVTNKWCWELYTPKKQILETFRNREDANEVERRLIKPVYNTDKWCLNENCGGIISLDACGKAGKISGKKTKELGIGVHSLTTEQLKENGRKGGQKIYELGVGIHGWTKEQFSENGKKSGRKCYELGVGVHALTPEERRENGKKANETNKRNGTSIYGMTFEQKRESGKKGGKKAKELGLGIHAQTLEERAELGKKGSKKTNAQKWICLETGYVSNSGALSNYQNKRGIDTSKRKRVE